MWVSDPQSQEVTAPMLDTNASTPAPGPVTRANSHRWVVTVTMSVRLSVAADGSVIGATPSGIPAPGDMSAPTCNMCGADNFDQMCPLATTAGAQ